MLKVSLSIHLVSVAIWVGGQLVLPFLLPSLRRAGTDADDGRRLVSVAAQRFQIVAWPALGVAIASGIWNLFLVPRGQIDPITLAVKLAWVSLSAGSAAAHTLWIGPQVRRRAADLPPSRLRTLRALSGTLAGLGALAAVGAMVWGVFLQFGG